MISGTLNLSARVVEIDGPPGSLTCLCLFRVEGRKIRDETQLLADYDSDDAYKRLPRSQYRPRTQDSQTAYLDGKIEKVQVPVSTRHAVLICNGHRYRSQTICKDRNRGAVRDI